MTSRDPERSSPDPNTLKAQYFENSCICYLAIITCKTVRSAILATAWLLVMYHLTTLLLECSEITLIVMKWCVFDFRV